MRKSKKSLFLPHFGLPWGRPWGNHAKCCMDKKRIRCLKLSRCMYPSIFSFPVIRNAIAKKSPFSRIAAHIFVSPGDAPATITPCVAWVERQFNARQTPRSMYLSIFNSFRVIWCKHHTMRKSKKSLFLPHFGFPWGRPSNNHAKYYMDGKRIRCLQIASLNVSI